MIPPFLGYRHVPALDLDADDRRTVGGRPQRVGAYAASDFQYSRLPPRRRSQRARATVNEAPDIANLRRVIEIGRIVLVKEFPDAGARWIPEAPFQESGGCRKGCRSQHRFDVPAIRAQQAARDPCPRGVAANLPQSRFGLLSACIKRHSSNRPAALAASRRLRSILWPLFGKSILS